MTNMNQNLTMSHLANKSVIKEIRSESVNRVEYQNCQLVIIMVNTPYLL